jgi:hypothetical protein
MALINKTLHHLHFNTFITMATIIIFDNCVLVIISKLLGMDYYN